MEMWLESRHALLKNEHRLVTSQKLMLSIAVDLIFPNFLEKLPAPGN